MQKSLLLIIGCILICCSAYRWGDANLKDAKLVAMEQIYTEVSKLMFPQLHLYESAGESLVYQDMEQVLMPVVSSFRGSVVKEPVDDLQDHIGQGTEITEETEKAEEPSESVETIADTDTQEAETESGDAVETQGIPAVQKVVEINRIKLQDFDYLRQNFYQIDNTTTIGSDQLDVNKLLGKDMTLTQGVEGPQILIYHTHSQEAYADSAPGDASTSVVALGDYLTALLTEKYGIQVLHHKGQYDVVNRDSAYSNALPDLEQILRENPSIEVVIDLHRDGVPATTHLVTEINGKQTAQIMFFNGLSRTTSQGDLAYLANPYIEDNLAFSFQMQLTAAEYYPGFTRKIYLKGYRYNMHLCPKSLLVEVGAQTNTFEEAKNAMEPLADILAKVLYNEVNE